MFTLQAGKQHGVAAAAHIAGIDLRNGVITGDVAHTVQAGQHAPDPGGTPHAVCFAQNSRSEVRQIGGDGQITGAIAAAPGVQQQHYVAQQVADTLTSHWHKSNGAVAGNNEGVINPVFQGLRVRRLMPVECERLQGFSDGHTAITYRNKPAADGPRYKAIGNSMAVPVMRWIGARIEAVSAIPGNEVAL